MTLRIMQRMANHVMNQARSVSRHLTAVDVPKTHTWRLA